MNCTECTHKKSAFSDLTNTSGMAHVHDKLFVLCAAGNTGTCVDFFRRNGGKPRGEIDEQLNCFEVTECTNRLDRLHDITNELLQEVRKK